MDSGPPRSPTAPQGNLFLRNWLSVVRATAFAGWVLLVLWQVLPSYRKGYLFAWTLLDGLSFPSFGAGLHAMAIHAFLLSAVVGLLAVWIAGGSSVILLFHRSDVSRVEGFCIRLALGWVLLAFTLFGLSLTGLFYPAVLVGAAIGVLLVSMAPSFSAVLPVRSSRVPAFPGVSAIGLTLLVGIPTVLACPLFLSPPVYVDFSQYHMAVPQHFLRLHKFAVEGVNDGFHHQLCAELLNCYGLLVRNDALAVFIGLVPYLAALVGVSVWLGRDYGWIAAGLAAGLGLTLRQVFWVAGTGKNDLAAAAMCLLALTSQAQRKRNTAALFWGVACAVKGNVFPFAGMAWLWYEALRFRELRRRWRPDLVWIGLAALPVIPWMAKGWLLMGDPLWMTFSRWLPGTLWDERVRAVSSLLTMRTESYWSLAVGSWRVVVESQPVLVMALPLVFLAWSSFTRGFKQAALLTLASYVVYVVAIGYEVDRLTLPVLVFWCVVVGVAVGRLLDRLPGWIRWVSVATICVGAWAPAGPTLGLSYGSHAVRYLVGSETRAEFLAAALTTAYETQQAVGILTDLRTLVLIGDHAPYRWPGRVMTEEFMDRSPTWVLTREANSVSRMWIRTRQRNVSHIALNVVADLSVGAAGGPYLAFTWGERQLELLRKFMRVHAEVAVSPEHCDSTNGAYYVYRLSPNAGRTPRMLFYLPGIKQLRWTLAEPMYSGRNARESYRRASHYARVFPDVGEFRMYAGIFAQFLGDWKESYASLKPLMDEGMVFEYGHGLFAKAAANIGKEEEALDALAKGRRIFPAYRTLLDGEEASVLAGLALRIGSRRGQSEQALGYARRARELAPDDPRVCLVLGESLLRAGRSEEAMKVAEELMQRPRITYGIRGACMDIVRRSQAILHH